MSTPLNTLEATLRRMGPVAVAVSGGVDSMTLAHIAHRVLGADAHMFHAVSAAVPGDATLRVRRHARAAGWALYEVDAGELADERYLANPVDRCFYCKTDLYGTIREATDRRIVSGTNTDDLGDYRPGLRAADDHDVGHPFVEAGMAKADVRAVAAELGLDDIAELPAAPCLASRIETGLRVTPGRLSTVEHVEGLLRRRVVADNLRCRVRADGIVIEVDRELMPAVAGHLAAVEELLHSLDHPARVRVEPYRRGSAFLRIEQ